MCKKHFWSARDFWGKKGDLIITTKTFDIDTEEIVQINLCLETVTLQSIKDAGLVLLDLLERIEKEE